MIIYVRKMLRQFHYWLIKCSVSHSQFTSLNLVAVSRLLSVHLGYFRLISVVLDCTRMDLTVLNNVFAVFRAILVLTQCM